MSDNEEVLVRKRNKRPHNPVSRKRTVNKMKRQAGLQYVGFSVKKNKMKQDTTRVARKMGASCTSPFCMKSKFRHCAKFDEETRITIFNSFWTELSWLSKKTFVQGLVKRKIPRVPGARKPCQFYLYLDGDQIQVNLYR